MYRKKEIITLDGPSGVGKSTISRKIAATLGYTYLDTGAMYRAVGLHLKQMGVDIGDWSAVAANLDTLTIRLLPAGNELSDAGVLLNGVDVSNQIRTPEMSMLASKVSAIPAVRVNLTKMQREIGSQGRLVAEGRDLGTVVFPDAAHKFFLDADIHERVCRRVRQLRLNGSPVDEEEILEMIQQRDLDDSTRSVAPLKKAEDALLVDTTGITIEEVCARILQKVLSGKPSSPEKSM
jgi:cytidylate kinase